MNPEELAQLFHETYETLAPSFGYKTREASAKPWSEVPENNRNLMIAVCSIVLTRLGLGPQPQIFTMPEYDPHLLDPIPSKPLGDFAPPLDYTPNPGVSLSPSEMEKKINKGK